MLSRLLVALMCVTLLMPSYATLAYADEGDKQHAASEQGGSAKATETPKEDPPKEEAKEETTGEKSGSPSGDSSDPSDNTQVKSDPSDDPALGILKKSRNGGLTLGNRLLIIAILIR